MGGEEFASILRVSDMIEAASIAEAIRLTLKSQTIVIGGLMEDRKTSTVSKSPLLGDIPLIGPIFARTQVTKSKTELLIFLTPHVAQVPELMQDATDSVQQGLKIAPKAVTPGAFDRSINEQQHGAMPFTQPTSPEPAVRPLGQ